MPRTVLGVGQTFPYTILDGCCMLRLSDTFEWVLGTEISRRDGEAIRHGRVEMAFRRFQVDGLPFIQAAIHVPTRPPIGGDTILDYTGGHLATLPSDRNVAYMASLLAVDTPTQRLRAIRVFALTREISELLYSTWAAKVELSDERRAAASAWVAAQPTPQKLFTSPTQSQDFLWHTLGSV